MTERFTLLSELGRGGMGVVWKARDEETGQIVALKLLHPALAVDADYVTRFERELELARRIHSAHVVQVLGFGTRDGAPYLALEYVDGPSLRELLASHGPYPWPETHALLIQIAQGLADAHAAGVVHRDLKPSNILIGSDGIAKLADFGIAKGLDLTRVTGTSTLLGTPAYLAPEGPLDERSDLYSLGIIAYELLTGAAPFAGSTYQEVIVRHIREAPDLGKLPPEARDMMAWLLAKNPAERPQRASALLPVLYGATQAPAARTHPGSATSPLVPPNRLVPARQGAHGQPASASTSAARPPSPAGSPAAQPALDRQGSPSAVAHRSSIGPVAGLGAAGLVVCMVAAALVGASLSTTSRPTLTPLIVPTDRGTPEPIETSSPAATLRHGAFSPAGSMANERADSTATLLSDGRVLVAGGWDGSLGKSLATAEMYDPATGSFSQTGSMTVARDFHTATLLPDGRVLVAGGYDGSAALATAELYDPNTGTFSLTGSMAAARGYDTATLLPDGRVLIAGGGPDPAGLASAELYDPKTGRFSPTGSMTTARWLHTASLLPDGRVLIAGGARQGVLATAEIYSPKTGTFSPTGSMTGPRYNHTATVLSDGRVLVAGGYHACSQSACEVVSSAELYDPKTGSFRATGPMTGGRAQYTATLLSDGRVLIAGGAGNGPLATAELYDPATGTFSPTGSMADSHYDHTATLLSYGDVLIAGGYGPASAELYTP